MTNQNDLDLLSKGVGFWNVWRANNRDFVPNLGGCNLENRELTGIDFSNAILRGANLSNAKLSRAIFSHAELSDASFYNATLNGCNFTNANLERAYLEKSRLKKASLGNANLRGANLTNANLKGAYLWEAHLEEAVLNDAHCDSVQFSSANLTGANLDRGNFRRANFRGANLQGASLAEANLRRVNIEGANFKESNLRGANLSGAILVSTNFENSILVGCHVYGCSAWDLKLAGCDQRNLVISKRDEPIITVDDIDVAQLMRLFLRNEKVRGIIDATTSKVVLILGRFTPERLTVLELLRQELRARNRVPVLFDFDKPESKDATGTVELLARLAQFIIADITDPSSVPHELATIIPFLRTTPVLPLRLKGAVGYGMLSDFTNYRWVLPTHEYDGAQSLVTDLTELITASEKMAAELKSTNI